MTRVRSFVMVGLASVGVLASAPAASAGGWAMSSLDPMSVPVAGEEVEVGFTIRQHGVTPVDPDEQGGEPVAVAVRAASGGEVRFPARQDGPTGHYVADVTFPEAGGARWEIRQGWFGAHDLGEIEVAAAPLAQQPASAAPAGEDATAADHRWPAAARAAAMMVAVAGWGVAVADARRSRRRVVDAAAL
jgi:hypothetical protein